MFHLSNKSFKRCDSSLKLKFEKFNHFNKSEVCFMYNFEESLIKKFKYTDGGITWYVTVCHRGMGSKIVWHTL